MAGAEESQFCTQQGEQRDTLLVKKLKEAGVQTILPVLQAIDDTCHYCWDADSNCQCWNDD